MVRKINRKMEKIDNGGNNGQEEVGLFEVDRKETGPVVNNDKSKHDTSIVENGSGTVEKSGFFKATEEREEREREIREIERHDQERRKIKLNDAAEVILSCLEPSSANDMRMAAKDYKIHDMGIYILGLINRLVKTVDYYEPDVEVEWEKGKVGYSDIIKCKYCGKEITEPKNLKQIYCSNRCSKRDRDFGETGIIFPNQHGSGISDMEMEEKGWEQEQKRLGAI